MLADRAPHPGKGALLGGLALLANGTGRGGGGEPWLVYEGRRGAEVIGAAVGGGGAGAGGMGRAKLPLPLALLLAVGDASAAELVLEPMPAPGIGEGDKTCLPNVLTLAGGEKAGEAEG